MSNALLLHVIDVNVDVDYYVMFYCTARKPITFTVESDMPHISGDGTIEVAGAPDELEADYILTFHPQLGGTYSGTLHFIDPTTGRYQWYTIEMTVEPPPPEDKLTVEAIVRQAVSLEISLTNPLQQVSVDGLFVIVFCVDVDVDVIVVCSL